MHINKSGKKYSFLSNADISEKLASSNYMLMYDQREGFFLQEIDTFRIPKKVYGNYEAFVGRVLNRFNTFQKTLGIHFTGEKGSGKTLLSQLIANESGLPTIIISESYSGADFINFLNSIEQPCVLLFDEFDKYYSRSDDQNDLLQVLDSNYATPKLIILTSNIDSSIAYLKNRPSRIFYYKDFSQMSDELIREILFDLLEDKTQIEETVAVIEEKEIYNIDSIMSFISEINFTKLSPKEAVKDMSLFSSQSGTYTLMLGDILLKNYTRASSILIWFEMTTKNEEIKRLLSNYCDEDGEIEIDIYSDFDSEDIPGGKLYTCKTNKDLKLTYTREFRQLLF